MLRLFCFSTLFLVALVAHGDESSRSWQFDLGTPGTYKVQVQHDLKDMEGFIPGVTKVIYSLTVGKDIRQRELSLIANQPHIPMIVELLKPQRMHVVIAGLSPKALQRTKVHVFDAATVPPGQYFDPDKANFKEAKIARALLRNPDESLDLAKVKVTIDSLIDPSVNQSATLRTLDAMVATVKTLPEFGSSSVQKLRALQRYIYESGGWNGNRPFKYDLEDPLGSKIENKLLTNYISARNGNCVTMPFLFVILGQRLGIDLTVASAPKHILVKWKNDAGAWINLEATSGGNPARDVWIRQQMPMTDEAITNGVYLRPLSKKETAALMVATLAEHYFNSREYEKAIAIADIVLESNQKDVLMMVLKGSAFGRMNAERFGRYVSPAQMPAHELSYLQYLQRNNQLWFSKAESLGWRMTTQEAESKYQRSVDEARQRRN